jgi:hypothetical protein
MSAGFPGALTVGLVAGIGVGFEFIGGTLLMIKLQSRNKFNYDSFYGILLQQFTILKQVSVKEIQILVGARIVACTIFGLSSWPWLSVIAILLYVLTTVHYIPNKKTRG